MLTATMTLDELEVLEQQAHAARSVTMPDTYFSVLVPGDALLKLVATQRAVELLRAHAGCAHIIRTLRTDRDDWAYDEQQGLEEYPGEARANREAYDLLLLLLEEAPR
jgi:hypothetical protein